MAKCARHPPAERSAPSGGTNPQREPAEVIDQTADYRDQGARYLVIANIGVLQPNLRKAMTSNLPFAKIIRGLKRLRTAKRSFR